VCVCVCVRARERIPGLLNPPKTLFSKDLKLLGPSPAWPPAEDSWMRKGGSEELVNAGKHTAKQAIPILTIREAAQHGCTCLSTAGSHAKRASMFGCWEPT